MKFRLGFVSNSSASSFIVKRSRLTKFQEEAIINHSVCARELLRWTDKDDYCDQGWTVEFRKKVVVGWTSMDNFSMSDFVAAIGVPMKDVKFEKDG